MKSVKKIHNIEKAQILPIVALMIVVLIAFAALLLDGGSIISNRRTAQAAADAGALAGAYHLCENNPTTAQAEAINYAEQRNDATSAEVIGITDNTISIRATVTNAPFFSRIFGSTELTATAEATAKCGHPNLGYKLLPIAFYWESPPISPGDEADETRAIYYHDYDQLMTQLDATLPENQPLDYIYIVAEGTKVCAKNVTGEVVCQGMDENVEGGQRTWIDLNAFNDSNKNLKQVMDDGVDNPIDTPVWAEGQTGVNTAIYQENTWDGIPTLEDTLYYLTLMPVYDRVCPVDPVSNCSSSPNYDGYSIKLVWDEEEEEYTEVNKLEFTADEVDYSYIINANAEHYRLVGFSPFLVTCVTRNDECVLGECLPKNTGDNTSNKAICPGYLATEPDKTASAIEGYFVTGDIPINLSGLDGFDAGINIISLIQQ